jgi:alpha-tubulin suppressor-like RCC1 family protein
VQVGSATDWALVSAGAYHNLARKTGGTLWAWGRNTVGELGLGLVGFTIRSPVQVGTDTNWSKVFADTSSAGVSISMAIKTSGTLWAWGGKGSNATSTFAPFNFQGSPTQITSLTNWDTVMNNSQSSYSGFAISNP